MNEELQELLQRYEQKESELLLSIKRLNPQPEHIPEVPLERLFYIRNLLSNGNDDNSITQGRKIAFTKVVSDYILTSNDDFLAVDCAGGGIDIMLPSAVYPGNVIYPISSRIYEIKKVDNTPNFVNILPTNSETIDDSDSFILNSPYESINLVSDGSNWLVF